MTTTEMRAEREELCHTFGFRNRWTAMVYQWCREDFGFVPDDIDPATVAEDCREFVTQCKHVPEDRLYGVDFYAVALALITADG